MMRKAAIDGRYVPGIPARPEPEGSGMIEIVNLIFTYPYGTFPALRSLDLTIPRGQVVLLTGVSGCGKSTLVRCLNGLIPHSQGGRYSGTISVDGSEVAKTPIHELATRVGVVFQQSETQLFNLTVAEELAFGPQNLGWDPRQVQKSVDFALEAVGIAHLRHRAITTLSGGEKQRVTIASVLAMRPAVLVLDEPASNLDPIGRRQMYSTMKHLNQGYGITILLVEHRIDQEILGWVDRVLVLDHGEIVCDGSPRDIFDHEREWMSRLGIRVPDSRDLIPSWLLEEGTSATEIPPRPLRRESIPAVACWDLSHSFRRQKALEGITLEVESGEFLALVGNNGAGKSTLMHCILGLVRPNSGTVQLNGQALKAMNVGRSAGLVLQYPHRQVFCRTVREEIEFGPRNYRCFDERECVKLLDLTDLKALTDRDPATLSGGEVQRAAIAGVLSLKPEILLLDEPTHGQDWGHLVTFMEMVSALNQQGITVIFTTHDWRIVETYARRVVHLDGGRIVRDFSLTR